MSKKYVLMLKLQKCIKEIKNLALFHYVHKQKIPWMLFGIQNMFSTEINRTRAIISRDLYTFYPIFHSYLYCRAVSI